MKRPQGVKRVSWSSSRLEIDNFTKPLMLHKVIGAAIRKIIFLSSLERKDKRGVVLWTICKTPTFLFALFFTYAFLTGAYNTKRKQQRAQYIGNLCTKYELQFYLIFKEDYEPQTDITSVY